MSYSSHGFTHSKKPSPAPTNLTSLESLAYSLTRLKTAQTSGWLLSYDLELSHHLGNGFRGGGKKAQTRSKREDAVGELLTKEKAQEGTKQNVGQLAERTSEPCFLTVG